MTKKRLVPKQRDLKQFIEERLSCKYVVTAWSFSPDFKVWPGPHVIEGAFSSFKEFMVKGRVFNALTGDNFRLTGFGYDFYTEKKFEVLDSKPTYEEINIFKPCDTLTEGDLCVFLKFKRVT